MTPIDPATPLANRAELHETSGFGERAADRLAAIVGSWGFIFAQSLFILAWIVLNVVAWCSHWDPYPWILLNLCMSTQAMYTGPIVMLSQNRQARKDRARDDLEANEVSQLYTINQRQLELLHEMRDRRRKPLEASS